MCIARRCPPVQMCRSQAMLLGTMKMTSPSSQSRDRGIWWATQPHAHTHARMHAHTHARMHACMRAHTHTHTHTSLFNVHPTYLPTGSPVQTKASVCHVWEIPQQQAVLGLLTNVATKNWSQLLATHYNSNNRLSIYTYICTECRAEYNINGMCCNTSLCFSSVIQCPPATEHVANRYHAQYANFDDNF